MTLSRVSTIYLKELTDIFRDRRTMIAAVVVPVVLYPLLILFSVQTVTIQAQKVAGEKIIVGLQNETDKRHLLGLLDEEKRLIAALEEKERPEPLADNIEIRVVGEFSEAITNHNIHCGLVVEDLGQVDPLTNQITMQLVYQPEDLRSRSGADRLQDAFERVAQGRVDQRLAKLDIDSRAIRPMILSRTRLTTYGSLLGRLLPLLLVLLTITSAIYPAIDLTAGEHERGTLETLMVCPVPVIDLIVGKFLTITTIAIFGAVMNLASVTATVYFGGLGEALGVDPSSGSQEIPLLAIVKILLSLVPFAILMSAVLIAICGYARSFKEAQNYMTPVIMAVMVPALAASMPGTKLEGVMLVMPVGNMVLLTRELLSGVNLNGHIFAWVLLSTCFYAAAAVAMAAQAYAREAMVFADTVSIRSLLSRHLARPSRFPTLAQSALYTAVLFPIWFYLQSALQNRSDDNLGVLLRHTALFMPLLFVAVPCLMLWYWKINLRATLVLHSPRPRFVLAAVLAGLSMWVVAHEVFVLQQRVLPAPEGLLEMEQALQKVLATEQLGLLLLFVAVIPAVCEEVLFRGLLMSGLKRSFGKAAVLLISAVAFGLFHFFLFKFATTMVLGLALAWLCWQAKSIWPAVLAHALHNGFAVVQSRFPGWQTAMGVNRDDPFAHLPPIVLGLAAVMLAGAWMLCRHEEVEGSREANAHAMETP